jgi:hypothetical protein
VELYLSQHGGKADSNALYILGGWWERHIWIQRTIRRKRLDYTSRN